MIQFKPIGIVRNGMTEAHWDTPWKDIESEIVVDEQWTGALEGLEEFSHIWVIFYFHQMTPPTTLRTRPMGRPDLPLVGRLATRTPQRPNPIGIAAVELLDVRGRTLRVRGLDALDGTPVLDIKPYLARRDALTPTRVSAWAQKYVETEPPTGE